MDGRSYAKRLKELSYAERQRAGGKFPAVLRFASVHPRDVALIIAHAERRIGDVSHIDASRSHLNKILVGEDPERPGKTNIAGDVMAMYLGMRESNHASNLRGLLAAGRKKDHKRALMRGPQEPWSQVKKHRGPLREFVLTLHRDAFRAADDCPPEHLLKFLDDEGNPARFDKRKCEAFVDAGMGFMRENFDDQLVYCRVDYDEQSVHLQGLLVDTITEEPSTRYASGRELFRLTQHVLIGGDGKKRGYELAQDAVGEFFAREEHLHLNVVRAEPRAARRREAAAAVETMLQEAELDALLGETDELPAGSKNAQAMHLLKKRMSEAVAEKGGDPDRVRKDQAQTLALEYLEELGVVSAKDRHEASTRRARAELIERHQDLVGTPHEIVADPDAAAEKVMARARAERAAADRRRQEAEAAEQRAIQTQERLDAERRAEAERRAREEAEREERHRREDEARAAKAADLEAREETVTDRETEISRKARLLGRAVHQFYGLLEKVKTFARRIGMKDEALDRNELDAVRRVKDLIGELGGDQR